MNRRQVLTGMALAPLAGVARAASWRTAATMPHRVQELYPVVHGGELIVAGGIGSRLGVPFFSDRTIAYTPTSDQWRNLPDLPESLHHAALGSMGGNLYCLGGFNGGYTHVWRMRSAVYVLEGDGWRQVGDLPAPQAEGVLTNSPEGVLHLVTGQSPKGEANSSRSDHSEVHEHWRYTGGQFESAAPIPTARNSATGGWLGGHLVVTGGRTAAGNLTTTEIYDPQADVWYSGKPLPLPQAGTASVVHNDTLIVFGGEIFVPNAGVFKEVWRYSLAADEWTAMPALPTPRHGLGAGLIDGAAYVVGGAVDPGGSGTSDANEVLVLSGS